MPPKSITHIASQMEGPRSRVIDILSAWQTTGKSIDAVRDEYSGRPFSDPRDNQLTNAILFGVLRNMAAIDWHISKFSKHPLEKMKPLTLQALRVGICQLLYLDRIPASAAINETVKVIKNRRQPKWLIGFVNGVLRNISRKNGLPGGADPIPLQVQLNHPQWLVDRWQKQFGVEQTTEICLLNNQPAPLYLCANSTKIRTENLVEKFLQADIEASIGVFAPEAIKIEAYQGPIAELPGYREGLFHVQDETAQLIVYLLSPFPPGRYLDGCAGLGGKTSLLAQKAPGEKVITAIEPQEGRLSLLKENLERLGLIASVEIFSGEIDAFKNEAISNYVGVLVDVPCSGTGVIRRHPDIRWNRRAADLADFQNKQLAILHAAAEITSPDGALVYSTCSMEPEENDEVIGLFLAERTDFTIDNAGKFLPESAAKLVDEYGFLRTTPSPICSDGFFAARLKRKKA